MSVADLQWPGTRFSREIVGSGGEIIINHGLIDNSTVTQVEAILPPQTVLLCVHLSGTMWMENRSDHSRFSRLGETNSANLGLGGLGVDVRYHAQQCHFARFIMATSIFERALDCGEIFSKVEFIDPQNEVSPQLAKLARRALALSADVPTDRLLADSIGYGIAAEMLRSGIAVTGVTPPRYSTSGTETKRMQRVASYIEDNLGVPMSLADLASISGLSVPQFMRVFRAEFGMPPYQWIISRKIDRAQTLMKSSSYSLTEIAYLLEFSSLQHFSSAFRKFCGISPSEYRTSIGRDQMV